MNKITVTITISATELTNLLSMLPQGTSFTVGEAAVGTTSAAPAKKASAPEGERTFKCTATSHVDGCWITKTGAKTFTAQYERQGLRSIECAKAGATSYATKALENLHASRNGAKPASSIAPAAKPEVESTPEPAPAVEDLIAELITLKTTDMRAYGVLLKKVVHVWKMDVAAIQLAVKAGVAELEPAKTDAPVTASLTSYPTN